MVALALGIGGYRARAQALPPDADPRACRVAVRARAAGGRVAIAVEDDGAGMSPDVAARAFEPYFTTKPPGVGTGLGLAICRELVGALGGTIGLESAPGTGTVVTVTLPAA